MNTITVEDAHGKENSGRFQGRNAWFGDFDQCERFSADVTFNNKREKWSGSYITIFYAGLDSTPEVIGSFFTAFCATPRCKKFMDHEKNCKYRKKII